MQEESSRPHIVVSCGDPNGIGLECFLKALAQRSFEAVFTLAIEQKTFNDAIIYHNLTDHCSRITDLNFASIGVNSKPQPGIEDIQSGKVAIASLDKAIEYLKEGQADALLTLPVSKHANTSAGWAFPGQTEMLGKAFEADPLMILCTKSVRVALATVHVPLVRVSALLTQELIVRRLHSLNNSLRQDFAIENPFIAVLGLNPHAGEQGSIGTEEQDVIMPALRQASADGLHINGPYPADGFFAFGEYKRADGILAMYHDQGLIPLKLLASGGGVNFTAGLPVVRVSPDHGTGFAIAGKEMADATSTIEAIEMALDIIRNRRAYLAYI